ncbi:unnamed protein product, partial [Discosporangium mesarthrocarpum]
MRTFTHEESCRFGAGTAPSVRRAVDAVEEGNVNIVIVLGDCADYRQVMTYAASRGLQHGWAWVLLQAARDPACHLSSVVCGSNDGRDAQALDALEGALSLEWSSWPLEEGKAAAAARAESARGRADFSTHFTPPPGGSLVRLSSDGHDEHYHSVRVDTAPNSTLHGSTAHTGDSYVNSDADSDNGSGAMGATLGVDVDPWGDRDREREGQTEGEEYALHAPPHAYAAVHEDVPDGAGGAWPLIHDAVELYGRMLVEAFASSSKGPVQTGTNLVLASVPAFDGMSGRVELDSNGDRWRGEVSFLSLKPSDVKVGNSGVSYLEGGEVMRFVYNHQSKTNKLLVLAPVVWPGGETATPKLNPNPNPDPNPANAGGQSSSSRKPGVRVRVRVRTGVLVISLALSAFVIVMIILVCAGVSSPVRSSLCSLCSLSCFSCLSSFITLRAMCFSNRVRVRARVTPPHTGQGQGQGHGDPRRRQSSLNSLSQGDVELQCMPNPNPNHTVLSVHSYGHQDRADEQQVYGPNNAHSAEFLTQGTHGTHSYNGNKDRNLKGGSPKVSPAAGAQLKKDPGVGVRVTWGDYGQLGVGGGVSEVDHRALGGGGASGRMASKGMASRTREKGWENMGGEETVGCTGSDSDTETVAKLLEPGVREMLAERNQDMGIREGEGEEIEGKGPPSLLVEQEQEVEEVQFTPISEQQRNNIDSEIGKLSPEAKEALKQVEIQSEDVTVGDIIGTGSFSEVRRGIWKGGRGRPRGKVAIKVFHEVSRLSLRRFCFEVLILKDLCHPNIVEFVGATWHGRRLMLVAELVELGNLATVLECGSNLTWEDHKFNMCCDVTKGMAYLHSFKYFDELSNTMQMCIIHRDLKPQNLLVTRDYRIKITDFG